MGLTYVTAEKDIRLNQSAYFYEDPSGDPLIASEAKVVLSASTSFGDIDAVANENHAKESTTVVESFKGIGL